VNSEKKKPEEIIGLTVLWIVLSPFVAVWAFLMVIGGIWVGLVVCFLVGRDNFEDWNTEVPFWFRSLYMLSGASVWYHYLGPQQGSLKDLKQRKGFYQQMRDDAAQAQAWDSVDYLDRKIKWLSDRQQGLYYPDPTLDQSPPARSRYPEPLRSTLNRR